MGSQVGSASEVVKSRRGGDDYEDREYIVTWSDTTWNTADMRYASGIPSYGQTLSSDRALYCLSKEVTPDQEQQKKAHVKCTFKTLDYSQTMPKLNASQNFWSIAKRIQPVSVEEPLFADNTGKACLSVTNEPFNPPIMDRRADFVTEISFLTNHTSYSATMTGMWNTWNSDAFTLTIGGRNWVYPVGGTRLDSYTVADHTDENGSICEAITMTLLSRELGNVEQRPNLSQLHWEGTPGTAGTLTWNTVISTDGTTNTMALAPEPWYLDATGKKIAQGGSIVLNSFTIGGTSSFASLINPIKGSGS